MLLVTSRFRVVNGMEGAVRTAFVHRPGLVNTAPGFLGMEVFTEHGDPACFVLVTRWVDEASYEAWHSGDGRRASIPFIPKGLKLDPAFTKVERMERVDPVETAPALDARVRDLAPVLARSIEDSQAYFCLATDPEGRIASVNRAIAQRFLTSSDALVGRDLWDFLTSPDAAQLQALLAAPVREPERVWLLNFVGEDNHPFTLQCHVDAQPTGLTLVGEEPVAAGRQLNAELMQLTNELSMLNREHQRKSRELIETKGRLEATLKDLQDSFWHLRKIQECLPVCSYCKKVKTEDGDHGWTDLLEFLTEHSAYLSHGLCPECFEKQMALVEKEGE